MPWTCQPVRRGGVLLFLVTLAAVLKASADAPAVAFSAEPVGAALQEDAEMSRFLAPFQREVGDYASRVVGYAAEPLERRQPECGLANLVADSLLAVGREEFGLYVDFAMTNYGGLRRDLPAGPLSLGLLTELSPFDNYLVCLEIDGSLAIELAEAVASGGLAVAGLEIVRDAEGRLIEATLAGKRLDRDRRYHVVTIDYLVETWGGLFDVERIRQRSASTRLLQRDALVRHLGRLNAEGFRWRNAGDGRIRTR